MDKLTTRIGPDRYGVCPGRWSNQWFVTDALTVGSATPFVAQHTTATDAMFDALTRREAAPAPRPVRLYADRD